MSLEQIKEVDSIKDFEELEIGQKVSFLEELGLYIGKSKIENSVEDLPKIISYANIDGRECFREILIGDPFYFMKIIKKGWFSKFKKYKKMWEENKK